MAKKRPGRKRTNTTNRHSLETRAWVAKNRDHHNWYSRNSARMRKGLPVDPEFEDKYGGKYVNQVRVETMVNRARARQIEDSHEIGVKEEKPLQPMRNPRDVPRGLKNLFKK